MLLWRNTAPRAHDDVISRHALLTSHYAVFKHYCNWQCMCVCVQSYYDDNLSYILWFHCTKLLW